jgi:hypothetical protein
MSRGTPEPLQDDSSSDWLLKITEEIRRLKQNVEEPEMGEHLISDLADFIPLPEPTTSSDEDYDMLSIVVNDALSGIDVMKKYPNFYARILANGELRTAFLETLELLEQSRSGELVDYSGPEKIDLRFLQQLMSKPTIIKSLQDKWVLTWQRSIEQLQNMFYIASLREGEIYRSDSNLYEENYINILHSQVELDEQDLEIRLDALQSFTTPENLELMLVVFAPEGFDSQFEVTVAWGAYRERAAVDQYGLAKLPSLKTELVFSRSGALIHELDLCLRQID